MVCGDGEPLTLGAYAIFTGFLDEEIVAADAEVTTKNIARSSRYSPPRNLTSQVLKFPPQRRVGKLPQNGFIVDLGADGESHGRMTKRAKSAGAMLL
jgi:hypothetical protein